MLNTPSRAIAFLLSLFLAIAVFTGQLVAQAKPSSVDDVLKQDDETEFACGACAIINAMRFADKSLDIKVEELSGTTEPEKVIGLMDKFASRPSTSYEGQPRYTKERGGVSAVDFAEMFKDVLADQENPLQLEGLYLDRREGELPVGHLKRVHSIFKSSLDAGLPIALSIRSFASRFDQMKSQFVWAGLHGHFLTLVKVQPEIRDNEKGFSFECVDSFSGKREYGYCHLSEARNFGAFKGDSKNWKFVSDRPFLLITAPSFRLKTERQGFHQRTIITANYAIVPIQIKAQHETRLFDAIVEAACGQCQLNLEGDGCDLAIRHQGKSYYVDGTGIDDHGDAHDKDGFCNSIRRAIVSGSFNDGRFNCDQFTLMPKPKVNSEDDK